MWRIGALFGALAEKVADLLFGRPDFSPPERPLTENRLAGQDSNLHESP